MKNLSTLLTALTLSILGLAQPVSIHDIQFTTDVSGDSPQNGNVVTTYGIVTGVFTLGEVGTFFIQDGFGAWNGIYVNDNTYPVTIGDSIEITATVSEYYGNTELIMITSLVIINSGNILPAPITTTTADAATEQYEGVVVQVINATCTNTNAGFGQFIVNDGSGNCLVDDQIFAYTPSLNYVYSVTGVRYYLLGEAKICPRMESDIDVLVGVGIEEQLNFSIYPNPANQLVMLKTAADAVVQIYDVEGKLVHTQIGGGALNVSEYRPGIYLVSILQNEKISTQKLIVY